MDFFTFDLCYKINLHFEIGDTLARGASVGRIEISGIDDKENPANYSIQRNAAPSNTLPCLLSSCIGAFSNRAARKDNQFRNDEEMR